MAGPSHKFGAIHSAMKDGPNPLPFYAKWTDRNGVQDANWRLLCPHVIGHDRTNTVEIVLCYQIGLNGHAEDWRCFYVDDLLVDNNPPDHPPTLPVPTRRDWKYGPNYTNTSTQGAVQNIVDRI